MGFTETAISRALVQQATRLPDRVVGDTHGPLELLVDDELGVAVDFSTANAITFSMFDTATGETKVDEAAGTGTAQGAVLRQPIAADVDAPGLFECQWTVDFDGAGDVWRSRRVLQRYIKALT